MPGPDEQMMQLMAGAQGGAPGAAPGAQQAAPPAAPMASPMSTPEPKLGNQQGAQISVQMASDLLQQSLPAFGADSEEGKAIMASLEVLTKVFGSRETKSRELMPSEILQLIQTLPQAGGASPEQRSMQSAPIPGMQTPVSPM